jgi:hypothetical protein
VSNPCVFCGVRVGERHSEDGSCEEKFGVSEQDVVDLLEIAHSARTGAMPEEVTERLSSLLEKFEGGRYG